MLEVKKIIALIQQQISHGRKMQVRRPLSDLPAQALFDFPAQAQVRPLSDFLHAQAVTQAQPLTYALFQSPKPLSKTACRVIERANEVKLTHAMTARRPNLANLVLSDMVYHTARCSKCEKVKVCDEFSADQTKYTGLSYICRQCESTRERERCATDPHYKIKKNLRSRFRHALKRSKDGKAVKCGHTLDMLGCSMDFFIKHIEEQFEPGMSWSNHGFSGFHIDHRIPCASFDLTDPEQQKKCFHFSNMQPMWASEKLSKGAKFV